MPRKNMIDVSSDLRMQQAKVQSLVDEIFNRIDDISPCLKLEWVGGLEGALKVVEESGSARRVKDKRSPLNLVMNNSM